jgi:hypothetical protein
MALMSVLSNPCFGAPSLATASTARPSSLGRQDTVGKGLAKPRQQGLADGIEKKISACFGLRSVRQRDSLGHVGIFSLVHARRRDA